MRRTWWLAALAALPALAAGPKPPADLPKDQEAGFKTWASKCSQCHNPERAYNNPKYADAKTIQALVARMARKPNANITRDDEKKIAAYLVWHAQKAGKTDPGK